MKKMILTMVVALATTVLCAGTVTWACLDIDISGGVTEGIAYLFEGDDAAAATLSAAIKAGNFDPALSIANRPLDIIEGLGEVFLTKIGSYQSRDLTLYMVLFDASTAADAKNFAISSAKTQYFGTAGNKTFDFSELLGPWTAVPEPTSMALLVLGVAVFGLRRKFYK